MRQVSQLVVVVVLTAKDIELVAVERTGVGSSDDWAACAGLTSCKHGRIHVHRTWLEADDLVNAGAVHETSEADEVSVTSVTHCVVVSWKHVCLRLRQK